MKSPLVRYRGRRFHWSPIALTVALALKLASFSTAEQSASSPADSNTPRPAKDATKSSKPDHKQGRVIDFERLETKDKKVYQRVTVRKIEPDSLLIEHLNGMARISLFDVSEEIQKRYQFNREVAIEHYKLREAEQRAMRKQLFHERIRQQAADEAETRRKNLERKARIEWIPAHAKILKVKDGNALAIVDRIVMRPTRTINALGGEGLPGPPKKEFVRISPKPVWLKGVGDIRKPKPDGPAVYWDGYIWPDGEVSLDPLKPTETTAAYRTLKPSE